MLTKTYWLWTTGPWDLPNPGKPKSPISAEGSKGVTNSPVVIGTETIISKNIFDPERGAGFTREAEANSQAFQRIRSMVLLGTAILGNNRFAILQDGASFFRSTGSPRPIGYADAYQARGYGGRFQAFRGFGKKSCLCQRGLDGRGSRWIIFVRLTSLSREGRRRHKQVPRYKRPRRGPLRRDRQMCRGQRVPRAIPALPRRDREPAAGE